MKRSFFSFGCLVFLFGAAPFLRTQTQPKIKGSLTNSLPRSLPRLRVASVFQDHMVLQRGRENPVFGKGIPGAEVVLRVLGKERRGKVAANGGWKVLLPELIAGGHYEFEVESAGEKLRFQDVLVGEVWLCSGQSNMQFALLRALNGKKEVAKAKDPLLRLLTVRRARSGKPLDSFQGSWGACTPETARTFSAVAYFFGRALRKKLGVPVGLIHSSWGGTPVEAWTSLPALAKDPAGRRTLEIWEGIDRQYPAALRHWEAARRARRRVGRRPAGPTHKNHPAGLFNAMIHPLIPFGMRGVIWYQGENNARGAFGYRWTFPLMIRDWRRRWGSEFPFLFVQLANFKVRNTKSWAELREAQALALRLLGTGMAVAIDIGNPRDIHPRNKQEVGRRLALLARKKVYGEKDLVAEGPGFLGFERQKKGVLLRMDDRGAGLVLQGTGGFELAGKDRVFHPAKPVLRGGRVFVSCEAVPEPVAVRYAWDSAPEVSLFNKKGLPAPPFRSDDWPGVTWPRQLPVRLHEDFRGGTKDGAKGKEGHEMALDQQGDSKGKRKAKGTYGPSVDPKKGVLQLVQAFRARGTLSNAAAFGRVAEGLHERLSARLRFRTSYGAEGMSLVFLPTRDFGEAGKPPRLEAWESPLLKGALAVSIDVSNPPTSQWFDDLGNIHHMPEREIALFWDGKERVRFLSPVEFRDEEPHELFLGLRYVRGGALVSLLIDDHFLCDKRFFAGLLPYESRPALGAHSGPRRHADFFVDDLDISWEDPLPKERAEDRPDAILKLFGKSTLWAGHRSEEQDFELPDLPPAQIARIVLTLKLEPGPGGWDEWDRGASVYLVAKGDTLASPSATKEGAARGDTHPRKIELFRYITPFRRRYSWSADVTDFAPLLRGKQRLGLSVSTWKGKSKPQKGFRPQVILRYYKGHPSRVPLQVIPLMQKSFRFGNSTEAIAKAFPGMRVPLPPNCGDAKLRITVTGHGQDGEFTPTDLHLQVAGKKTFDHHLWNEEVYLNPCRPQSGTWKFHRAAWAPGSYVPPWEVELGPWINPGSPLSLRYWPSLYPKTKSLQASHSMSLNLILYR